jgi:hypothetical protein
LTYTSALTLSSLPACVMTEPAHEWPTSTTGPFRRSIARVVAETSSPRDVRGAQPSHAGPLLPGEE